MKVRVRTLVASVTRSIASIFLRSGASRAALAHVPPRSSKGRDLTRIVLSIFIAACGGGGQQIPRDRVTSPGEALFNGYTKPGIKCFECHDGTGRGTKWGPALATRVPKLTDEQIGSTIRTGKGKMPSFAGKLTDGEIAELVTWLRGTFGHPSS